MSKRNKNKALKRSISPQRLHRFSLKADGDLEKAFELYEKNVRLSAGFYPILSFFEVCLRNKIHEVMTEKYGDDWLMNPETPLQEIDRENVEKAYERLREKGTIIRNMPEDMGRVVADLSLGFWIKLLTRGYSHSLWCSTLRHAFPNYRGDLKSLRPKLNRIWKLRNRVAHYEPIIFMDDIEERREEILEVIGWMCKDTEEWVRRLITHR